MKTTHARCTDLDLSQRQNCNNSACGSSIPAFHVYVCIYFWSELIPLKCSCFSQPEVHVAMSLYIGCCYGDMTVWLVFLVWKQACWDVCMSVVFRVEEWGEHFANYDQRDGEVSAPVDWPQWRWALTNSSTLQVEVSTCQPAIVEKGGQGEPLP